MRFGWFKKDKVTVKIITEESDDHIEIKVLSKMKGGERASDAVVTDLAALRELQISR